MEQEEVLQKIRKFIIDNFYFGKPGLLKDDTDLMEEGAVSSTGFLELVTFVEETFGISVDDDELTPEYFGSIEKIANFVMSKVSV